MRLETEKRFGRSGRLSFDPRNLSYGKTIHFETKKKRQVLEIITAVCGLGLASAREGVNVGLAIVQLHTVDREPPLKTPLAESPT
jgi:hypothetical protein